MTLLEIVIIISWLTDTAVASGMMYYAKRRNKPKAVVTWFGLWVLVSILYYWIS